MPDPVDEAIDVFTRWGDAFVAGDVDGMIANMHFPHVRLKGSDFQTWQTEDDFRASHDQSQRVLQNEGFSSGGPESIDAIQFGPKKVHVAARISRRDTDGAEYKTFETLWIMTMIDGKWGAQFRSTFQ